MEANVRAWRLVEEKETTSAEETMVFGAHLASIFSTGNVVALIGPLGAGKTTLVRGLITSLGFSGRVRSPSFTLIHRYETSPVIYHADLYRLREESELIALDFDEAASEGVLLVEWADRFKQAEQDADYRITLQTPNDGNCRKITLEMRDQGADR